MPDEGILETILEKKADLLAISVTFPLNLHKAESLINLIKSDALASKTKIMVGGYPFLADDSLWQKIGADAYAADASLANSVARNLIQRPA
jgi:methanogenic corrinoid protein MtbC1